MNREILFHPLGDRAVVITLGTQIDLLTHRKVKMLFNYLSDHPFPGLIELVPAYTTVTVYYDPYKMKDVKGSPYVAVCDVLKHHILKLAACKETGISESSSERVVNIPVCYDDEFGADLAFVASHNDIDIHEVIQLHTQGHYVVNMIGFVPGFPYLAGMSHRIAAPRKESPRQSIPAGSVGIAGLQTGIYSLESPGGWQIIGRTPLTLFQPLLDPPTLLQFGDKVRFYAITRETFDSWGEKSI